MLIAAKDLRFCIDAAREATETYKLHARFPNHSQRSVDELLEICGAQMGKTIVVSQLNDEIPESTIKGFFVLYPDHCHIVLHAGLNTCWRRFVLCKEIFHALIDAEEYRSRDLFGHLQEVAIKFPVIDSTPAASANSEFLAELAAMEFFFPFSARKLILAETPTPDYFRIAHQYKIPQVHVEAYLSPDYMDGIAPFMP